MAVYYWQGGTTGAGVYNNTTTYGPDNYHNEQKSRFDWNRQGNWRTNKSGLKGSISTSAIPRAGDLVYVGVPVLSDGTPVDFQVKAPLLFGGFQGGSTGGHWSRAFLSNPTNGGTLNSHLNTIFIGFKGNAPYFDPYSLSTHGLTLSFNFAYPFPLLGGGITGSTIDLMKGVYVEGMTYSDWDTILAGSTYARERELRIKSNNFHINPVGDSLYNKINWSPAAGLCGDWEARTGGIRTIRVIDFAFVDSIRGGNPNTGVGGFFANYVGINAQNSIIYIRNAKIHELITNSLGVQDPSKNSQENFYLKTPAQVYVTDSTIGVATNIGNLVYFSSDENTTIGTYEIHHRPVEYPRSSPRDAGAQHANDFFTLDLSGKIDPVVANNNLNITGTNYGITYEALRVYVHPGVTYGLYGMNINLGKPGDGITFTSWPIKIENQLFSGNPNIDLRTNLYFSNSATIPTITLYNANIQASNMIDINNIVTISTLTLEKSVLNLSVNRAFNNWRFGRFTGNTLIGGIEFEDSDSIVKGDSGVRLINYAVFNKSLNWRTGGIYTSPTQAFPDLEANA